MKFQIIHLFFLFLNFRLFLLIIVFPLFFIFPFEYVSYIKKRGIIIIHKNNSEI